MHDVVVVGAGLAGLTTALSLGVLGIKVVVVDDDLADARTGKQTLCTHEVEINPAPDVTAGEVLALRERLHLARAVFARYLRTNPRTLENWEQGRAKPNAQLPC